MPLVLFAGQSNALGFGNNDPAPYTPTWRVQIWTGEAFNYMDPGRNTGTPANPAAWGPEVGFARDWLAANPTGILYLGKVAKGETGLAPSAGLDWSPASQGEMFDRAAGVAAAMRANLGVATLDAVFWMQGEQDATDAGAASAYGDRLTAFLGAVRADWMGDAGGYVGAGRIGDSDALPFNLDVRVAQWQVDQVDDHLETFRTLDFEMQADGLHYAADGHLAIGHRFFDAWAT